MLIDEQLFFKCHIAPIEKKLSHIVRVFAKMDYYLPSTSIITPYYSLVHAHLV